MRKKGYAAGLCFMALVTIALVATGVATTEWTVGKITVNKTNSIDCYVVRKIGLFQVVDSTEKGDTEEANCVSNYNGSCSVYSNIIDFSYGLQYTVIVFCGLSMLCSFIVIAVAAFNICSNPYETYLSAIGMMIYNIVGLVTSLVAVILYTILLYTQLDQPFSPVAPEDPPKDCKVYGEGYYIEDANDAYFGFSFFLVVVSIVTHGLGVVLAILSGQDTMKKIQNFFSPKKEETGDQKMKDIMIY